MNQNLWNRENLQRSPPGAPERKQCEMKSANNSTRALLILMVGLALFYPLLETVDFWDSPDNVPRTGSDTEFEILGVLLTLGLVVVLARLVMDVGRSIRGSLLSADHCIGANGLRPAAEVVFFLLPVPLRT